MSEITATEIPKVSESASEALKKMRIQHEANFDLHQWTPMSITDYGGREPDFRMLVGCPCGAYMLLPIWKVNE